MREMSSVRLFEKRQAGWHVPSEQRGFLSTERILSSIDLYRELAGHTGCVNTLKWNKDGTLLASGSDDTTVRVWNVEGQQKGVMETEHTGNIFGVEWIPGSSDRMMATGAGDGRVMLHDFERRKTIRVWPTEGRIKRVATSEGDPYVFWSISEDTGVRMHDARTLECATILHTRSEGKCVALSPVRPDWLAVASEGVVVPVYDKRRLDRAMLELAPAHLCGERVRHEFCVTHVAFSRERPELLANAGRAAVYLYDLTAQPTEVTFFEQLDMINSLREPLSTEVPARKFSTVPSKSIKRALDAVNMELRSQRTLHAIAIIDAALAGGDWRKEGIWTKKYQEESDDDNNGEVDNEAETQDDEMEGPHTSRGGHPETSRNSRGAHPETSRASAASSSSGLSRADRAALLSSRVSALGHRKWEGDTYEGARSAAEALLLEPYDVGTILKLASALNGLEQRTLANEVLTTLKARFPRAEAELFGHIAQTIKDTEQQAEVNMRELNCERRDYKRRYVGHLNEMTDIKEANFFGPSESLVVAGSDCGALFIWERESGRVRLVLSADSSTVNCVQPHPFLPMLASSGIDDEARLWLPRAKEEVDPEKSKRKTTTGEGAGRDGGRLRMLRHVALLYGLSSEQPDCTVS